MNKSPAISTAERSISLPGNADVEALTEEILTILRGLDGIKGSISVDERAEGKTIRAETEPSLRSWGETVTIEVRSDRIVIESESGEQLFDWGKSRQNVSRIAEEVAKRTNDESVRAV